MVCVRKKQNGVTYAANSQKATKINAAILI